MSIWLINLVTRNSFMFVLMFFRLTEIVCIYCAEPGLINLVIGAELVGIGIVLLNLNCPLCKSFNIFPYSKKELQPLIESFNFFGNALLIYQYSHTNHFKNLKVLRMVSNVS